jgi:Spermidine/putrescine-binding periplasmic protein
MSRILVGLLSLLVVVSCTKKSQDAGKQDSELNLAIWGNYLSPELQEKFTKETGIKINISNYSSNEELLAKVQTGGAGIDVAVPSDYMVEIMAKMNLLEPLAADKIPNQKLIAPMFLKQSYDPEGKYSIPYIWTTAGITVNRELYKGPVKSWKDLLDNPALKGKFALLDDVRETTGAALKMLGYSVNTTNPEELKKAKEVLLKTKKNVKMFTSDTIDILSNKEVVAAQTYSSDALQAAAKEPGKFEYVIPEEGATWAIDNLVIIKGAKHTEAAHKLINFLLEQESELNKVKTILGGPVLKDTQSKLPRDLQNNKAIFPSADVMNKLERIKDLGDEGKPYEDIWTAVKTN